jgi:hypothetical protein
MRETGHQEARPERSTAAPPHTPRPESNQPPWSHGRPSSADPRFSGQAAQIFERGSAIDMDNVRLNNRRVSPSPCPREPVP